MSESRTIDFRQTYWSHNISLRPMTRKHRYTGSVWSSPRPRVGDKILWRTEYGHAIAKVKKVDYCQDPRDMCFIECKVVDRVMARAVKLRTTGNE